MSQRFRFPTRLAALAGALAIGSFAPAAPAQPLNPYYYVDETALPFDALPGATAYWGVHKNAGYRIEVPGNWNGKLALYAHGFRGYGPRLTVDNPRIREYLIENGYAWAASSFSRNGYDIGTGVQDMVALLGAFRDRFGAPTRTYMMGESMGGHVAAVAIEQYPKTFSGALPVCGNLGDVELFDWFLDYNLVAQALVGWPAQFPPPPDYLSTTAPTVAAMLGLPGSANPVLTPAGTAFKAATRQLTGGDRPLFDTGFYVWNQATVAPGVPIPFLFQFGADDGSVVGIAPGNVASNVDTVYQLDGDPALSAQEAGLNTAVLRVAFDPQARHADGIADIPPISGKLPVPVISLHTLGDLFVPFSMQQAYARRVAEQSRADLLRSRAIRDVGHCAFLPQELAAAFADLVAWAEQGVEPAGDDILDAAAVADELFGCQFTLFDRPLPGVAACSSP
jgi:pimeloyl-ACP methyl ester carboxylesterase